jgi:hypothetical protein
MLLQPTEAQLISTILPVSNVLDDEDRSGVVKMMWEIVHADGSVSECEANLICAWRNCWGCPAASVTSFAGDEAHSRRLSTLQDRRRGGDLPSGDVRAQPERTE